MPVVPRMGPLQIRLIQGGQGGSALWGEPLGRAGLAILAYRRRQQDEESRTGAIDAQTQMLRGLNDATMAATDLSLSSKDMLATFDAHTQEYRDTLSQQLKDLPSQDIAHRTLQDADAEIERRRFGIDRMAQARAKDEGVAALSARVDEGIRAVELAPTQAEKLGQRAALHDLIQSDPNLPATAKQETWSKIEGRFDENAWNNLLLADPATALKLASDVQRFATAFPHLDPEADRLKGLRAAQIEMQRRQTEARAAKADAEDAAVKSYLPALLTPGAPIPDASIVTKILSDKNLPPGVQEHLVGLYERKAAGADLNKDNPIVANELAIRAYDRTNPNPLTRAELNAHLGVDIGLPTYLRYMAAIEGREEPLRQAFGQVLTAAKPLIEKPIPGVSDQPALLAATSEKYAQFQRDAADLFEKAIAEGWARDFLDPSSDRSLVKMIPRYQIGVREGMDLLKAQGEALGLPAPVEAPATEPGTPTQSEWERVYGKSELPGPLRLLNLGQPLEAEKPLQAPAPQAPKVSASPRKPGETPEEWVLRTGGK